MRGGGELGVRHVRKASDSQRVGVVLAVHPVNPLHVVLKNLSAIGNLLRQVLFLVHGLEDDKIIAERDCKADGNQRKENSDH